MPDLDDDLASLRENLRESVVQPDFATVAKLSRQRTVSRRTQVAAVAAVLVVGAAIPLLRNEFSPADEPTTPAAPPSSEELPVFGPDASPASQVHYADDQHGYALRAYCDTKPNAESIATRCSYELLATADGQHWLSRGIPGPSDNIQTDYYVLYVLGPDRIALVQPSQSPVRRWYSNDAGKSWQAITTDREQVSAIPDGALIEVSCRYLPAGCRTGEDFTMIMPDTGRSATLATPPPLTNPDSIDLTTADDGWWVSGTDPQTGRVALAVSRDAGRTWSVTELPAFDSRSPADGVVGIAGPGVLYAAAIGELPNTDNGLLAIFASTDDGRTWQRTWQATVGAEPRGIRGVPIAAADGRLIVNTDSGGRYASTDHGRTFAPANDGGPIGYVTWTRAGYLVIPVSVVVGEPPVYQLSQDGIHWKAIPVG